MEQRQFDEQCRHGGAAAGPLVLALTDGGVEAVRWYSVLVCPECAAVWSATPVFPRRAPDRVAADACEAVRPRSTASDCAPPRAAYGARRAA